MPKTKKEKIEYVPINNDTWMPTMKERERPETLWREMIGRPKKPYPLDKMFGRLN